MKPTGLFAENEYSVATDEQWLEARKELFNAEKELTHHQDRVSELRRQLPWRKLKKEYTFHTTDGDQSLSDLFEGRSQLIVYHFMLRPEWEEGCTGCSFGSDHFDGALKHIENHDVKFVAVSLAPLDKIQAFRQRMGWKFNWVSSHDSDFNYDYQASYTPEQIESGEIFHNWEMIKSTDAEHHGMSVFAKNDKGEVFHTYSAYARGTDNILGAHILLDMTPRGRNEETTMDWVRLNDQYGGASGKTDCCHN